MRVLKDDGKGLARVTSIEGGKTPQTRQFRLIAALLKASLCSAEVLADIRWGDIPSLLSGLQHTTRAVGMALNRNTESSREDEMTLQSRIRYRQSAARHSA